MSSIKKISLSMHKHMPPTSPAQELTTVTLTWIAVEPGHHELTLLGNLLNPNQPDAMSHYHDILNDTETSRPILLALCHDNDTVHDELLTQYPVYIVRNPIALTKHTGDFLYTAMKYMASLFPGCHFIIQLADED